jgi:DNA recombination protein RmuC
MPSDPLSLALLAAAVVAALLLAVIVQAAAARGQMARLRLLAEQSLAAGRGDAETLRATLASTERALMAASATAAGQLRLEVAGSLDQMRLSLDSRLRELREGNEARLGEIQKTVNEQLHAAVEKQMTSSFARVTEQFAAVQKAMGDVQAVTAQIGDIKRLFGNVKTRGGWGETQLRAMLDDILPDGAYDTNWKPRPDSDDAVEFAVIMPMRGETKTRLPIDAKFPVEDYERLLAAAEAGDMEAERAARRALERRVRDESRKLATKYIAPPATVDFAVMYVPTDGLYAEIARIPGLIDDLNRSHHILVLGPALFPALLRTIHLGHITLSVERNAQEISRLLGATRTEMRRIDDVFARLGKQVGTVSTTIEAARTRTRAVDRALRSIEAMDEGASAALIGIEEQEEQEGEGAALDPVKAQP